MSFKQFNHLFCSNRKKEYMSRRMSEMDRLLSERHLFHGTSADVVEGICKHNFDPRVCGKHATMFGQGSYFARKAVYSHNFSKRSPKGVHCMFLAKVLTGRCVWVFILGSFLFCSFCLSEQMRFLAVSSDQRCEMDTLLLALV